MASSKSAAAYLLDPLSQPEPSQDTGLGASLGSVTSTPPRYRAISPTSPASKRSSLASNNPFRDSILDDRAGADGHGSLAQPYSSTSIKSGSRGHHRRTSSLKERFPGDDSHKPLEIIRKDSVRAHRSPHLHKRHISGLDTIDRLDTAMGPHGYHHEGPYDAASFARNNSYNSSPIAALETSIAETIKATPRENIMDSIERHRPLDGVAAIPSGGTDRFGRTYQYEEGADLLREPGGDGPGYKRWADKDYSPDDLKGKGEPTFSLDRSLQARARHDSPIEMSEQKPSSRSSFFARDPMDIAGGESQYVDKEIALSERKSASHNTSAIRRTGSLRAAGESIKRRIGSLRRKQQDE